MANVDSTYSTATLELSDEVQIAVHKIKSIVWLMSHQTDEAGTGQERLFWAGQVVSELADQVTGAVNKHHDMVLAS